MGLVEKMTIPRGIETSALSLQPKLVLSHILVCSFESPHLAWKFQLRFESQVVHGMWTAEANQHRQDPAPHGDQVRLRESDCSGVCY